jgi:hypothetical protein
MDEMFERRVRKLESDVRELKSLSAGRLRSLAEAGQGAEIRGYLVWGLVFAVVVIPEIWAATSQKTPFAPLSAAIGHLSPTAKLLLGALVAVYTQVQRGSPGSLGPPPVKANSQQARHRRLGLVYLPLALIGVAGPSIALASLGASKFTVSYVIFGLTLVFSTLIPNALAYLIAVDVSYPTLTMTVDSFSKRSLLGGAVVRAGLAMFQGRL